MKFTAIKEHHLYQKAYTKGNRFVGKYIAVYILRDLAAKRLMQARPDKTYVNRIGLAVTKKIGGACVRTRSKRIIREAYRAVSAERPLKKGYLVVLSARGEIVGCKTQDIAAELRRAFTKLQFFADCTESSV